MPLPKPQMLFIDREVQVVGTTKGCLYQMCTAALGDEAGVKIKKNIYQSFAEKGDGWVGQLLHGKATMD